MFCLIIAPRSLERNTDASQISQLAGGERVGAGAGGGDGGGGW